MWWGYGSGYGMYTEGGEAENIYILYTYYIHIIYLYYKKQIKYHDLYYILDKLVIVFTLKSSFFYRKIKKIIAINLVTNTTQFFHYYLLKPMHVLFLQ